MTQKQEIFIEKPVKTEYILCFPPREMLAGNFFNQITKVIRWQPEMEHQYTYPAVFGERKEENIHDVCCLFMKSKPETSKGNRFTQIWLQRKIRKYILNMENDGNQEKMVCRTYDMEHRQDFPYSLRLYGAWDYLEHLNYGKKTRIGIIEGNAISRSDLIALIRQYYDKMNYLTIFSQEISAYEELADDSWEQFGLAVTVTGSLKELEFCDCILDCTVLPFEAGFKYHKGCSIFSICGNQKKIRCIRKAGGNVRFDSCANILDRAFHNKV